MLIHHVARYVALQQKLGLKFDAQRRILERYARHAEDYGDQFTLSARLYEWCETASTTSRASTWFDTVRQLCVFLNAEDSRHEVPATNVFGQCRIRRPTPHILDADQIRAIVVAALDLPPRGKINSHTYSCLFGLLAATGLRISEALALKQKDITDDGLTIHHGKFGKKRLIPLHPTVRQALMHYVAVRNKIADTDDDLFIVSTGRVPARETVCRIFLQLARKLGIRGDVGIPGPRLHDLRHTFAVRSLEACIHDSRSVGQHMATLSTYLGHSSMAHTYWYLEATPVLLHKIAVANEVLFNGGRP